MAFALEIGVRPEGDNKIYVLAPTIAGGDTDAGAGVDAGRNFHFQPLLAGGAVSGDLNMASSALGGFLQGNFYRDVDGLRRRGGPAAFAEEFLENVTEVETLGRTRVALAGSPGVGIAPLGIAWTGVLVAGLPGLVHAVGVLPVLAVLVVLAAVVGVREDFISLVDLLKTGLGGFITGVDIWVVFSGEPAVGLADIGIRGLGVYAQDLIIVSHEASKSSGLNYIKPNKNISSMAYNYLLELLVALYREYLTIKTQVYKIYAELAQNQGMAWH
jgi:hypothetical protein